MDNESTASLKGWKGMASTPEYKSWSAMKGRCLNPSDASYADYGGRGITICQRWIDSFPAFFADMGARPEGTSLDRWPNNDGNYEPGNCRWATSAEQNANRRPTDQWREAPIKPVAPGVKSKKARPTVRERAAERLCPNCGKPSPERKSSRGPAPLYCDNACKRAMNNRNLRDGLALVPYVKAWRIDRGSGEIAQTAFARMCKIADDLNDSDRRECPTRPRADYYAATLIASQAATVDELRYGRRKVAEHRAQLALEAGDAAQPAPAIEAEEPVEPAPQVDLAAILKLIADGHNDPRALAAAALAAR